MGWQSGCHYQIDKKDRDKASKVKQRVEKRNATVAYQYAS